MSEHVQTHWNIGKPDWIVSGAQAVVALTSFDECESSALKIPFHVLVDREPLRAARVDVWVPSFRGKSFFRLLSWVVSCKLCGPETKVVWHVRPRSGDKWLVGHLREAGWSVEDRTRGSKTIDIATRPNSPYPLPEISSFERKVGAETLHFEADFGVFSPTGVDSGTELLIDVAAGGSAVESVADIGIGYGAVTLSLLERNVARRAVGTEVDSVSLWLAARNARAQDRDVDLILSENPTAAWWTELTVCNVPTHIGTVQTDALIDGILDRQSRRTLLVVHRSLQKRYVRRVAHLAHTITLSEAHSVLEVLQ